MEFVKNIKKTLQFYLDPSGSFTSGGSCCRLYDDLKFNSPSTKYSLIITYILRTNYFLAGLMSKLYNIKIGVIIPVNKNIVVKGSTTNSDLKRASLTGLGTPFTT